MVTAPTNTSVLRGQDPKLEDPCPRDLKSFLFGIAEMKGRHCQILGHLLRGKDRLNLYTKIYKCCYINYIDIFNFGTHSGFHLTEQDTGGKTFFTAT